MNINLLRKNVILCFLFLCQMSFGQKINSEPQKIRFLEFGLGLPSITFREKVSSGLSYNGTGLASLHFATTKQVGNEMFREFSFNFNVIGAKPAINKLTAWNKGVNVFAYNFMWRKLKGIGSTNNWHYFTGLSLSNNSQIALMPAINNSISYNINWLQVGLEGMIKKDFQWHGKDFQFTYQANIPMLGINVRPQSFIGIIPEDYIWSQNASPQQVVLGGPKLSSLNNNFIFKNDISLDMRLRKSKLRLQYSWQYTHNTVSINSLNSVISSLNFAYLVKLKNK